MCEQIAFFSQVYFPHQKVICLRDADGDRVYSIQGSHIFVRVKAQTDLNSGFRVFLRDQKTAINDPTDSV